MKPNRKRARTSMWLLESLAVIGLILFIVCPVVAVYMFFSNLAPFSPELTCLVPLILILVAGASAIMAIMMFFQSVGEPGPRLALDEQKVKTKVGKKTILGLCLLLIFAIVSFVTVFVLDYKLLPLTNESAIPIGLLMVSFAILAGTFSSWIEDKKRQRIDHVKELITGVGHSIGSEQPAPKEDEHD